MAKRDVTVVLGATGNVGAGVVRRLLAEGQRVRAVARSADRLASLGDEGAETYPGRFRDEGFLAHVLRDATSAFVLTPGDVTDHDSREVQFANVDHILAALPTSRVEHVVLLSSWGADQPEGSAGVMACRRFEQGLASITGLNAVFLRPVWFMDNFIWNVGLIKLAGMNGLAISPDTSFPMVASSDIAPVAAAYLSQRDFVGQTVHYLEGDRDYTMREVTRTLGASIGQPNLPYYRFPDSVMKRGLTSSGISPSVADLLIETNHNIDSGRLTAEPRSAANTTSTSLEEFARTVFAPAYLHAPDPTAGERIGGRMLRSYLTARSLVRRER